MEAIKLQSSAELKFRRILIDFGVENIDDKMKNLRLISDVFAQINEHEGVRVCTFRTDDILFVVDTDLEVILIDTVCFKDDSYLTKCQKIEFVESI